MYWFLAIKMNGHALNMPCLEKSETLTIILKEEQENESG